QVRLWTFHPRYLDPQGLVALWREALLARVVLLGRTRGYAHHPQLLRFQQQPDPPAAIARYLGDVLDEASGRSYEFDASKIASPPSSRRIIETDGPLLFEWDTCSRSSTAVPPPPGSKPNAF
ncbi:MAG TPA: pyrimidine dimer DNA glycosylase/endonuclease V, partial [Anaerolineales bacterium]|nr:pyrimidine dimer DNA glycosylase/endonuclease V [Anaerolineales bacterium]